MQHYSTPHPMMVEMIEENLQRFSKKLQRFSENLQRFSENLQRFSENLRRIILIQQHRFGL